MEKNISSLIKPGDNIEIEITKKDSNLLVMKSNVINTMTNNTVIISTPIHKGRIYPIQIGKKINIIFYKKNTGKYYFVGEVIKRANRKNLSIIYIKKVGSIHKMQRRDYFRLNIILNVDIEIIENDDFNKKIRAITKDISGGGLRIICKEKLNLYSLLKCTIPLENESIKINGEVVRCNLIPDSISRYDVGIKFIDVDETIRKKIISFIFKKQRKIIKKGLI